MPKPSKYCDAWARGPETASRALREEVLGLADLTWGELSRETALFPRHPWPCSASQAPFFGKCAMIPHQSPTVITCGVFNPTCLAGAAPPEASFGED